MGYRQFHRTPRQDSEQHTVVIDWEKKVWARSGCTAQFWAEVNDNNLKRLSKTARNQIILFRDAMSFMTHGDTPGQFRINRCAATCAEPLAIIRAIAIGGMSLEEISISKENIWHRTKNETRNPCKSFCRDYIDKAKGNAGWLLNLEKIETFAGLYRGGIENESKPLYVVRGNEYNQGHLPRKAKTHKSPELFIGDKEFWEVD